MDQPMETAESELARHALGVGVLYCDAIVARAPGWQGKQVWFADVLAGLTNQGHGDLAAKVRRAISRRIVAKLAERQRAAAALKAAELPFSMPPLCS